MMMSPPSRCRLHQRWVSAFAGTFALLTIMMTASVSAQDAKIDDPVLAKVNGIEIHQSDITIAEQIAGQLPPMDANAKRDYLVQFVTDTILVSKAAEAKKLGDSNEFKKKVEFSRRRLLMEALLSSVGKEALTDPAMHQVYDDAIKQMGPQEEVHARHILIRAAAGDDKANKESENKIKAIIARLNKGEDFAKVANEVTEDPSGKADGGDLGYFTKDQMVPEFSEAAFKLDKGKISGPVKTQFGWHVIKVEDKRTKPAPNFEDVKPQVEQYLKRKAQTDLVTKLRESAKVEKMYKTETPSSPANPQEPAASVDKPAASGEKK
jgi:peptidyl-prolyl cis-trans isomerase C